MTWIIELIKEIVATFIEMAPYLLLGLVFAGILHVLFKKEYIIKHLGRNNFLASLKASLFGVPLPLCSCGVVPTALSLRKSNASEGATISFLISTPQTGVDSIIATYGMLGPIFAIFRPIAALFMGVVGGTISALFTKTNNAASKNKHKEKELCKICDDPNDGHSHNFIEKIQKMIQYAFGSFLDDISLQLVVGIILAGVISYFVPPDFFAEYVNNDLTGMLLMIIAGIPLYVCATASIPIAASLMLKGLSPGAAFVFLAVGPATNAATITLIGNVMGKKVVALYLSVISLGAILSGFALNFVYTSLNLKPSFSIGHHHEMGYSPLSIVLSLIFLITVLLSIYRKVIPRYVIQQKDIEQVMASQSTTTTSSSNQINIGIEGMTCNHCVNHVTEMISAVTGVEQVSVNLSQKLAVVEGEVSRKDIKEAIKKAGYRPVDD